MNRRAFAAMARSRRNAIGASTRTNIMPAPMSGRWRRRARLLCVIQIEDTVGISNLRDMLKNVPGIAAVVIGQGDLSQELGIPRQTEHKELLAAMAEIVAICKENNVVVGHPLVTPANAERVIAEGYRWLMCPAPRSFAALDKARALAGRT